jgi:biopolymer transport protein ExbB
LIDQVTLVIMGVMSMVSWYILVTKLIESIKISGQARDARATFFKASSLQSGLKTLREGSPFRFIAETAIQASEHHEGELTENIDRNEWVTMSVERSVGEVQSSLQDGLAFLASVGSTAPFIGLFGTVMGIYNALTAIGVSGQASIDKVAGPVGAALIMTAIGLAVAVPAVLGYNWLVRRNKVTMDSVRSFAADLHGVLMGAKASR